MNGRDFFRRRLRAASRRFVLSIRELNPRRLSFKIGLILAVFHLSLLGYIVRLILSGTEPDWPMYWLIFMGIDFPVSLLFIAVGIFLPSKMSLSFNNMIPYPVSDVSNFILPVLIFGILGTAQWFALPIILANLSRILREKGQTL